MKNWQNHKTSLILTTTYLLAFLAALAFCFHHLSTIESEQALKDTALPLKCALFGGFGGIIYLLRAVYLRCCVFNDWSSDWAPWYLIRPIASILCGYVSYLFISAGLIILESDSTADSADFGYYALAILAGLNVDRFINRIEEVGKAVFGIEKSRTSQQKPKGDSKDQD